MLPAEPCYGRGLEEKHHGGRIACELAPPQCLRPLCVCRLPPALVVRRCRVSSPPFPKTPSRPQTPNTPFPWPIAQLKEAIANITDLQNSMPLPFASDGAVSRARRERPAPVLRLQQPCPPSPPPFFHPNIKSPR